MDEKLEDTAFFRKVDLHVHSYESHDFPKASDKAERARPVEESDHCNNVDIFLSQLLEESKEKKLKVVAITDHHKSRVACELAAKTQDQVLILPGMEIAVQCSEFEDAWIELLVIFPPEMCSEDIDRVFANTGMPDYTRRRAGSKITRMRIGDFIRRVHENGGICIASHVNSNAGVRNYMLVSNVRRLSISRDIKYLEEKRELIPQEKGRLGQLRGEKITWENTLQDKYLKLLVELEVDGVEVQKPEDIEHYRGVHVAAHGLKSIACLLSSDAHRVGDIGLSGHTTFLKMGRVNHEGVRRALKDPEVRIRLEEEFNRTRQPYVKGLEFWPLSEDKGFFQKETIGFSENLNCLIGGRGAGKSAIIDAVRFLFMQSAVEIDGELQKAIVDRQQATLSGVEVRGLFEVPGAEPVVLTGVFEPRTESSEHPPTKCYSLSGSLLELHPANSEKLQIELFGWSEIEILATSQAKQRQLLDGFIPEIVELKQAKSAAVETIRRNTNKIIEKVREVHRLLPSIRTLGEKREELRRLDTPEMRAIFRDLETNEELCRAVESAKQQIISCRDQLALEEDVEIATLVNAALREVQDNLRVKGIDSEFLAERSGAIQEQAIRATSYYKKMHEELGQIVDTFGSETERLAAKRKEIESRLLENAREIYKEKLESGDMDEEDIATRVRERSSLAEQVRRMEQVKGQIDDLGTEINNLLNERWNKLMSELNAASKAISDVRSAKVKSIVDNLQALQDRAPINMEIQPGIDRYEFERHLGSKRLGDWDSGVLRGLGVHYLDNRYAEQIARAMMPTDFAKAVYNKDDKSFVLKSADDVPGIGAGHAKRIVEHLSPWEDDGFLDPNKLQTLLESEHCEIEDAISITLEGQSIEYLSPGQRCTALLPIILTEGTTPLIIDQPEDNLDNRLVFDLVVDVLRALKGKRQIIVATHNPNIPVSGDAEQIVVLEALSKYRGRVALQGSIDNKDIIKSVTEIMEGSEEAFRVRAEKYGYLLSRREV
ncbi:TrlF family AAA-like ATPase [Candidatus Hakubella thermalkaliphila]|uniref:TrlF family AAA-like ATPase n=1 Tax=Candidatus Hakubella thermalkaliphila TaxID=2754717 RepID=UPI001593396D|nr:hypothetical protein [Candidatus Hakubella thermalkaliphila]